MAAAASWPWPRCRGLSSAGPWEVEFPADSGAPPWTTLEKLVSWSEHAEAGVRYFSGTATYRKKFNLPADAALVLTGGCISTWAACK